MSALLDGKTFSECRELLKNLAGVGGRWNRKQVILCGELHPEEEEIVTELIEKRALAKVDLPESYKCDFQLGLTIIDVAALKTTIAAINNRFRVLGLLAEKTGENWSWSDKKGFWISAPPPEDGSAFDNGVEDLKTLGFAVFGHHEGLTGRNIMVATVRRVQPVHATQLLAALLEKRERQTASSPAQS